MTVGSGFTGRELWDGPGFGVTRQMTDRHEALSSVFDLERHRLLVLALCC